MHKTDSALENENHECLTFETKTNHLIPARTTEIKIVLKKETYWIVVVVMYVDKSVNFKESKKREKYLDFASELKKLWNIRIAVIHIFIGAPVTVPKCLEMGLEVSEIGG